MRLERYYRNVKNACCRGDSGQTLTEYALLLGLLALAAVGSLTAMQGGLGGFYSSLVSALTAAFG
ncbi:MAG TPA: Flp family type IVb pilin [Dehalococcoidia bacterium]|jgi:Flp pilus assembly pilin Flp